MPKSSAERKAEQRRRQAASGGKKLELVLDNQEVEMLAQNCAARRPGREPYELNEYITMLIRKDAAELAKQMEELAQRKCVKCHDQLPVAACPCQGDSQCWVTSGYKELILTL